MPLYFAYGSNMDRDAMRMRCPGSTPIGPARLARHRFVIMREGYASVVRDPRGVVWGLLWDLALDDCPALDRYEGVAGGLYVKVQQPVLTRSGARRALIYVGRGVGGGVPRPGYMEAVAAAAASVDLPADYLHALGKHIPGQAGQGRPVPPTPRVRPLWSSPVARDGEGAP